MTAIHVSPGDVSPILSGTFPEYRGRKVSVVAAEKVTLYGLSWEGGSRNTYRACSLAGGPLGGTDAFKHLRPEANPAEGATLPIPPGAVVVCLTEGEAPRVVIYANPADMPAMLPHPAGTVDDLPPAERFALLAARTLKSSHNGRDRYQLARDEVEGFSASPERKAPSRAEYDAAKVSLAARGLLDGRGAITLAGRNLAGSSRL